MNNQWKSFQDKLEALEKRFEISNESWDEHIIAVEKQCKLGEANIFKRIKVLEKKLETLISRYYKDTSDHWKNVHEPLRKDISELNKKHRESEFLQIEINKEFEDKITELRDKITDSKPETSETKDNIPNGDLILKFKDLKDNQLIKSCEICEHELNLPKTKCDIDKCDLFSRWILKKELRDKKLVLSKQVDSIGSMDNQYMVEETKLDASKPNLKSLDLITEKCEKCFTYQYLKSVLEFATEKIEIDPDLYEYCSEQMDLMIDDLRIFGKKDDFYQIKSISYKEIPPDIDEFFRNYPSDGIRIKYERLLEILIKSD